MAVLGDARPGPRDVGARADRMGRGRADARPRIVAGLACGVRALRRRRPAVRAARATAPRRPRTPGRDDRHRHRRPGRGHRFSLFVFRHGANLVPADCVGAAAGAGRHGDGSGDVRRSAHRMARHLPPPHARRARQLRHADDQQRRRRAGRVSNGVRLRLHVDPSVRVPTVGRVAGSFLEHERRRRRRRRGTRQAAAVGDLHGGRPAPVPRLRPASHRAGRRVQRVPRSLNRNHDHLGAAAAGRAHRGRARRAAAGGRDDAADGVGDRADQGSDPGDDRRRPLPPRQRRVLPRDERHPRGIARQASAGADGQRADLRRKTSSRRSAAAAPGAAR